jgi:hypothetical protein
MAWCDHDVERIAREFHETYEYVAPFAGWRTQEASRVEWADVPESNRRAMLATVENLLDREVILAPPSTGEEA